MKFLSTFLRIIDEIAVETPAFKMVSSSRSYQRCPLTFLKKIKVLQHSPAEHMPNRRGDPTPLSRNLDSKVHPFARQRERMRALNATKLDRIFAKPFVGSLDGHVEAVEVLARRPKSLSEVASGSWDGGACSDRRCCAANRRN